jgi:hypothetical protein
VKKSCPFSDEFDMIDRSSAAAAACRRSRRRSAEDLPRQHGRVLEPFLEVDLVRVGGRQLVFALQFGLRTSSISLFGW